MVNRRPTIARGARVILAALIVNLLIGLAGCSQPTLHVEGEVVFDGKPVESGSITFEPTDGKGRDFGGVITDGKYKIVSPPGLESGTRIVRIAAMRKTGRQIPAGSPLPPGTMVDEIVSVPKIYNEKSELTADLEVGKENRFDFKLKAELLP